MILLHCLSSSFYTLLFCTQDEKNQILTTNIWLNLVSWKSCRCLADLDPKLSRSVSLPRAPMWPPVSCRTSSILLQKKGQQYFMLSLCPKINGNTRNRFLVLEYSNSDWELATATTTYQSFGQRQVLSLHQTRTYMETEGLVRRLKVTSLGQKR